jgi:Zn ribbon nucleic-acid-binding protein
LRLMAIANCPRCENKNFLGWNYNILGMQLILVMCSNCGAVVGAVPKQG